VSGSVPGLARALLERALPPDRRDDVIGDLAEVHARRQVRARVSAWVFTNMDALAIALAFAVGRGAAAARTGADGPDAAPLGRGTVGGPGAPRRGRGRARSAWGRTSWPTILLLVAGIA
jgi:hypothetical protein